MLPEEIDKKLESFNNVNVGDFYTDGELDLAKAKRLAKLHLIRSLAFSDAGEAISIDLYNDFSGYIYLIRAETSSDVSHVKIGKTNNVKQRLSALNAASPAPLTLVYFGYVLNADKLEKELHDIFDERRLRGEWFALDNDRIEKARSFIEAETIENPVGQE